MSGWLHTWPLFALNPLKGCSLLALWFVVNVCWDIFHMLPEVLVEIPLAKYNVKKVASCPQLRNRRTLSKTPGEIEPVWCS